MLKGGQNRSKAKGSRWRYLQHEHPRKVTVSAKALRQGSSEEARELGGKSPESELH